MKLLFKFITFYSLTIPNILFGQSFNTDTTKPSSFIPYCNDREDNIEKPIHLDWIQTDKDIIKDKLNNLPAIGSTLSEIKKLIPHFLDGKCNCQSITQDLGYGLKSTQHTIHGGYGSCNVDAIYFGDIVLKLRLTISNHREVIEKYLLNHIKLPFDCMNGHICYEKTYSKNVEKYLTDSGQVFLESADTNYRRRQAINYFTDVLTGGTFTKPFYITFGLGSETFNNLRFFIVNKDYQALESILFSPSPTSRLFAARTLRYMQEKFGYVATSDTDKRMKDIFKNAQLISSGIISCHIGKFEYDYFDIVKNFEQLLTTH
jgi:hypothetical protein